MTRSEGLPEPIPRQKSSSSLHVVPDGVGADDNAALTLLELLGCLHSHRHGTARAATCQDTQGTTITWGTAEGRRKSRAAQSEVSDLHKAPTEGGRHRVPALTTQQPLLADHHPCQGKGLLIIALVPLVHGLERGRRQKQGSV